MKKPFNLPRTDSLELIFDMTPLVDMVFQLLVFFLLTSAFSQPILDLSLPKAKNIQNKEKEELVRIVLKKSGKIFIQDREVNWKELEFFLKKNRPEQGNKLILIQADEGIFLGRFVRAIDLLKGLGFSNLAIMTEEERQIK